MSKQKKQAPSQAAAVPEKPLERTAKKKPGSAFLFATALLVMLIFFTGRWIYAINTSFFHGFVRRDASVSAAMEGAVGLELTALEQERLLPLQRQWDMFQAYRLEDQVTITARDGVTLYADFYDEGSDATLIVIPRFESSSSDVLLAPWLHEQTGCNILLTDPRTCGESGGEYFGYGYLEQYDLADWVQWIEDTLGEQTILIWGEGTGANTALYAAASGLLPESVEFIVAESAYHSMHELAAHVFWEWHQIPTFPFLNALELQVDLSGVGYRVRDLELADALAGSSANIPVLFLQSAEDAYILPEWSSAVYEAYPGEKLLISGGTGHGTVNAQCQEEIQAALSEWLKK